MATAGIDDPAFDHVIAGIWPTAFAGVAAAWRMSDPKDILQAAATPAKAVDQIPANNVVKRWIVDYGCGHDLIGRTSVASFPSLIKDAVKSLTFQTASGPASAKE